MYEIKPLSTQKTDPRIVSPGPRTISGDEATDLIDIEPAFNAAQGPKCLIEIKIDNELVLTSLLSGPSMSDLTTALLTHTRMLIEGSQIILTKKGVVLVISERSKDELSQIAKDLIKTFDIKLHIDENEAISPTISAVLAYTERDGASYKELYHAADQLIKTFSSSSTDRWTNKKRSVDNKSCSEKASGSARFEMCKLF